MTRPLILLTAALWATGAGAHDAASGLFSYPGFCCNGDGHSGDCQEIDARTVTSSVGGYRVTLNVGDHRKVTRLHVFDIPQSAVRDSPDGRFHICLYPTEDKPRCFFAPPPGV